MPNTNASTTTNLWRNLGLWLTLLLIPVALYFTYLCKYPYHRAAQSLSFPYQLDAEEGFLLGQSLRIVSGKGLYLPIDEPPYVVDNYPPLYPALWSAAARWAGPSLAPGRWISLAGSALTVLGIAALIFGIGKTVCQPASPKPGQLNNHRPTEPESVTSAEPDTSAAKSNYARLTRWRPVLLAWLCPLLFLTSAAHLRWMAYARVDLLAIGLSVCGLALIALWGSRKSWARGAAVVLFALAFLTKQTSIMAPAACLIYLFLRNRRIAYRFLLELAIAFLLPFTFLTLATRGQFYLHTITYNENAMHWSELRGWAFQQRALYAPLLLALTVLTAWTLWLLWPRRKSAIPPGSAKAESDRINDTPITTSEVRTSPPPALLLVFLYFLSSTVSLPSLAKAGAAENYLLEPTAAAVIFLGVALSVLLARATANPAGTRHTFRPIHAAIAAAVVVLLLWHTARFHFRNIEQILFHAAPSPNVSALFQGDRVVREIRQRPGPVLSEDPIYILKAGEPILFQHFIMTQLAAERKWNPAPVVQMAERAEFSLIAAHQDLFNENQFFNRYPPALRAAIRKNFSLLERLDRGPLQPIFLYIPQQKTDK